MMKSVTWFLVVFFALVLIAPAQDKAASKAVEMVEWKKTALLLNGVRKENYNYGGFCNVSANFTAGTVVLSSHSPNGAEGHVQKIGKDGEVRNWFTISRIPTMRSSDDILSSEDSLDVSPDQGVRWIYIRCAQAFFYLPPHVRKLFRGHYGVYK